MIPGTLLKIPEEPESLPTGAQQGPSTTPLTLQGMLRHYMPLLSPNEVLPMSPVCFVTPLPGLYPELSGTTKVVPCYKTG